MMREYWLNTRDYYSPVAFEGIGDVVIAKVPVKLFSGAVTLAGTLATAGLLLDSATTAPPFGAPALKTSVPLELFPP